MDSYSTPQYFYAREYENLITFEPIINHLNSPNPLTKRLKTSLLFTLLLLGVATVLWRTFVPQRKPKVVHESFYYWKNTLSKADFDTTFLSTLNIKKLYIKLFDVGFREGEGVVPVSSLVGDLAVIPSEVENIPTVFITNEAFLKTEKTGIDALAQKVFLKIQSYYSTADTPSRLIRDVPSVYRAFTAVKELQIDCDWSEKTREKYFDFLKKLKTLMPPSVKLSVTIRLHQVKYRSKTGVPPVDRGMLMMYNVLNPREFSDRNSIFDAQEVESYLKKQKVYPLPLDVVLPLFSWGITYRHNKFFELLNGLTRAEADKVPWLEKNNTFYLFRTDTVIQNHYFRIGDLLKIEDVTPSVFSTSLELARPIISNDTLNVSFFHYDSKLINDINPSTIQNVYKSWR
jgi:hypothetical protein